MHTVRFVKHLQPGCTDHCNWCQLSFTEPCIVDFGADAKSFVTVVDVPSVTLFNGELTIKGITIVTILACVVIMVGLTLFVKKTKPGRAMLAVSEDRDAAQLMGVNVNATISLTFAIGSGLAAIAGLLLCQTYPVEHPAWNHSGA